MSRRCRAAQWIIALRRMAWLIALASARHGSGAAPPTGDWLSPEQTLRALSETATAEELHRELADDPALAGLESDRIDVARARSRLNDAGLDREQRQRRLSTLLDLRRTMIDSHPGDARRALWLADQAADVCFLDLPFEGAGLTALFGLPTAEQQSRARRAAGQVHQLAAEAELELGQLMVRIQSTPKFGQDQTLQDIRRRLDQAERGLRVPFLRGVGACLQAELNLDQAAQQRPLWELAAETLTALRGQLEGPVAAHARAYAGLALARLGRFEDADQLLRQAAGDPAAGPGDVFLARMGAVINRLVRGGPPSGLEALDSIEPRYAAPQDLFYRMIIVDRRFLIRRDLARRAGAAEQPQLWVQAYGAYLDLLGTSPRQQDPLAPGPTVDPRTLRAVVQAKLVLATADDAAPLDQLPPIVTIARASHLAGDPAASRQAIALLEPLLQQPGMDDASAAAALLALGRALLADERPVEAAQRFFELARDHPTQSDADRAIELACTIAAGESTRAADQPAVRSLLRESLELLLSRYPNRPGLDRWRMLAGQVALAEDRLDDASRLYAQLPAGSEQWAEAQLMQAAVARAALLKAQSQSGATRPAAEQLLAVVHRVGAALAGRADHGHSFGGAAVPEQVAAERLARLWIFEAEALLALDQPDRALSLLEEADRQRLPTAVVGDMLRVRIAAARAAGRSEQLADQLRRLLNAAPDQAHAVVGPLLTSLNAQVIALQDDGRERDAAALAKADLLPLVQLIDPWLSHRAATEPQADAGLLLAVADGLRLSGEWPTALARYDALLRREPAWLEASFGRAECLHALGGDRLAQAMELYKRLAASRSGARDRLFWQSQLRMLQILDQTGRNTQQIAPQIRRLRQQDPNLGGDVFRRHFDALRNKYL